MFQKVKRIIGIILVICFSLTALYIGYIRITNNSPQFFGLSLWRVSDDSMVPELDVDEIIVVKTVEPETLEFGDVICYRGDKGHLEDEFVTHQISKEPYEIDGVYYFTTRGIKPEAVDDPEITDDQIIGKVLYKIPFVGTLFDFFSQWYGIIAFIILILIIFSSDILGAFQKMQYKKDYAEEFSKNSYEMIQRERAFEKRLNEYDVLITDFDDEDF